MRFLQSPELILLSASILAIESNHAAWVASSASNKVPWGGSFKVSFYFNARKRVRLHLLKLIQTHRTLLPFNKVGIWYLTSSFPIRVRSPTLILASMIYHLSTSAVPSQVTNLSSRDLQSKYYHVLKMPLISRLPLVSLVLLLLVVQLGEVEMVYLPLALVYRCPRQFLFLSKKTQSFFLKLYPDK